MTASSVSEWDAPSFQLPRRLDATLRDVARVHEGYGLAPHHESASSTLHRRDAGTSRSDGARR
jgi:hypothetical protein